MNTSPFDTWSNASFTEMLAEFMGIQWEQPPLWLFTIFLCGICLPAIIFFMRKSVAEARLSRITVYTSFLLGIAYMVIKVLMKIHTLSTLTDTTALFWIGLTILLSAVMAEIYLLFLLLEGERRRKGHTFI